MNLVRGEFRKTLIEARTYYPDYIVGFVTDFFLLLIVLQSDGDRSEKVFAYILWILASGVLSEASMCISSEKQLGTLQNIMTKPYSISQIMMVKTMVWFFINLIKAVITSAIARLFFYTDNLFRVEYLFVLVMVCVGIMGASYFFAAMTLVFTKVASFVNIISYLFLFLSGSIVKIPEWMECTNPLSYGVKYSGLILKREAAVTDHFLFLIICVGWFLCGYLFFLVLFHKSKQFKWTY